MFDAPNAAVINHEAVLIHAHTNNACLETLPTTTTPAMRCTMMEKRFPQSAETQPSCPCYYYIVCTIDCFMSFLSFPGHLRRLSTTHKQIVNFLRSAKYVHLDAFADISVLQHVKEHSCDNECFMFTAYRIAFSLLHKEEMKPNIDFFIKLI